jgi:hypothetical protein
MNFCFLFLIAFNWKEKKALKLDSPKKKEFKVRPLGFDMKDLSDHVDPGRGDVIIDITKLKDWKEPAREPINQYKVVDVTRLYGPDKPCGPLVVPREEYTGGYQRRQMSKGRAL